MKKRTHVKVSYNDRIIKEHQELLDAVEKLKEENRQLQETRLSKSLYENGKANPAIDYGYSPGFNQATTAIRNQVSYRYDILDPEFERCLAVIADFGAKKYGDYNWKKSRLSGGKSPINHMRDHLNKYTQKRDYDHSELGEHYKYHLIAIAFNAMMEFVYENDSR